MWALTMTVLRAFANLVKITSVQSKVLYLSYCVEVASILVQEISRPNAFHVLLENIVARMCKLWTVFKILTHLATQERVIHV